MTLETEAVSVIVPVTWFGVTWIVTVATPPLAMSPPSWQVTVPADSEQVPDRTRSPSRR